MSREDTHRLMTLSILAAGVSDPMALLAGMQSKLRDSGADLNATDMQANGAIAEANDAARAESINKAIEAANKAISGMPKWCKRLVGAILSAVGTVASIVTGGASVALTVIGCILIAGAEVIQTLADRGIINPTAGGIVAACLKVVASVIMSLGTNTASAAGELAKAAAGAASTAATAGASAVSGAVAGAGVAAATSATVASTAATTASLATTIAKTAADVAKYAEMAIGLVNAGIDMHNDVRIFQSEGHRLDAEEHALRSTDANEHVELAADGLRSSMESHSRAIRRIHSMIQLQGETSAAAASGLA